MDSIVPSTDEPVASSSTSKQVMLLDESKSSTNMLKSPLSCLSEDSGSSSSSVSDDSSSESGSSSDPISYDPDFPAVTEFTLFPKLPILVRQRVWKFSFPNARVVVYEKEKDKYHCFGAEVPTILHVCKESRKIGLSVYSICFGTETHAPAIPFDLEDGCLLFDDWLAASSFQSFQLYFMYDSVCGAQMTALIGAMGLRETNSIHRVTLPASFLTEYRASAFSKALKVLFDRFKSIDYLVLTLESRSPYDKGPVLFFELTLEEHWCCATCLLKYHTNIPAAIKTATELSRDEKCPAPKFHVRGIYRGSERSAWASGHPSVDAKRNWENRTRLSEKEGLIFSPVRSK
ncbi:hypothetical protein DL98DRAFT_539161 [Cadophora sp. DSE1049]|nr:hypothetical protein DL98DRAFT_539161 [Cadophora sp. DSE1049]